MRNYRELAVNLLTKDQLADRFLDWCIKIGYISEGHANYLRNSRTDSELLPEMEDGFTVYEDSEILVTQFDGYVNLKPPKTEDYCVMLFEKKVYDSDGEAAEYEPLGYLWEE